MSNPSPRYEVAIIGGGIVGLATAMALAREGRRSLIVLEAEADVGLHQTGHNSGVIHSGLYYKPGSRKAKLCVEGREALYRFCEERGIAHERCGKLIVAANEAQRLRLGPLADRARANGLTGLRELGRDELREFEPHVTGLAGLLVPDTGIVNFRTVARAYADVVREAGHPIHTRARVTRVRREAWGLSVETTRGRIRCGRLINCGGLQSDRIARLCGLDSGLTIVPFRGEYYELVSQRRHLVRNLIYPVPEPDLPFLGVHFTRTIQGAVEAGPNALLAWNRQGYHRFSFSPADAIEMVTSRGFRRMVHRNWKTGVSELARSVSKWGFARSLARLIPELRADDLRPAGCGVRAQAVDADGTLVDDFRVLEADRMVHVLNTPSPAATASIPIGQAIARMASDR